LFLSVLAYYINNKLKLNTSLIRFKHLLRAYTKTKLAKILQACLYKYNIKNKVIAIITNNISNNNTLILEIKEIVIKITTSNKDSTSYNTIVYILYLSYII
jgi:hypothetical protein